MPDRYSNQAATIKSDGAATQSANGNQIATVVVAPLPAKDAKQTVLMLGGGGEPSASAWIPHQRRRHAAFLESKSEKRLPL